MADRPEPGYPPDQRYPGVGPHPKPWPDDPRLDPDLLREGDSRNVIGPYRYWSVASITAELDRARSPMQVAVENWQHDLNIGSIVRTSNAFNVAGVHIVGRRDWNRRGAMVTDRYLHVHHHPDVTAFASWSKDRGLPIIGIDNIPGSTPLENAQLPEACVLFFGQEGPGLSEAAQMACTRVHAITQYGSTRSLNAAAAGAIAMYAWALQHRTP